MRKREEMRPNKKVTSAPRRRSGSTGFTSSDPNPNSSTRAAASLLDRPIFAADDEEQQYSSNPNPRSFPHAVKQQCWEKAEKVKGRDPDRWRRDPLGNLVFRKLVGCPGCFCHDYDHIVPYSKGGKSTLENCQVLQHQVFKIGRAARIQGFLMAIFFQISILIFPRLERQSIDLKEIRWRYPDQILYRKVLTVGFKVERWIYWNSLPMAMSEEVRNRGVVAHSKTIGI